MMNLYDEIIKNTEELLRESPMKKYIYREDYVAEEGKKNQLILSKEAAFHMGENTDPSVAYTLITNSEELVSGDEIVVYGQELQEIKGNTPFARITIIRTTPTEAIEEQEFYKIFKGIEMLQYGIEPKGYMVRPSALSNLERVRVSKEALKAGITFEKVGNLFIRKYKANPYVKAVKVIFITLKELDYKKLDKLADTSKNITAAMNHIISDLNMDCKACQWKPVCDEVEGMKDMHIQVRGKGH